MQSGKNSSFLLAYNGRTGLGSAGFTGHKDDTDGGSQVRDRTERTKVENVPRDFLGQVLGHRELYQESASISR